MRHRLEFIKQELQSMGINPNRADEFKHRIRFLSPESILTIMQAVKNGERFETLMIDWRRRRHKLRYQRIKSDPFRWARYVASRQSWYDRHKHLEEFKAKRRVYAMKAKLKAAGINPEA